MLRKLKSKSGEAILAVYVIMSLVGIGIAQTAQNGTLKKNGKLIWCKMQNKGNDYCDITYR